MPVPKDKLSKWEDIKEGTLKQDPEDSQTKPTDKTTGQTEAEPPPQTEGKTTSTVFDVAIMSADTSYGAFLNNLLNIKAPDLTTNFGKLSESEQLASLDSAKIIVALLSPNLINSGKHVDEYHIALARHRKTRGKPVLYSVQIQELPRWPTYFHIVPCRIAVTDTLWKEVIAQHDVRTTALFPPPLRRAAVALLREYNARLSSEAMLALAAAADDIIDIVRQPQSG